MKAYKELRLRVDQIPLHEAIRSSSVGDDGALVFGVGDDARGLVVGTVGGAYDCLW